MGHALPFVFAAVPQPGAVGDQVFRRARVRLGLAAADSGHQLEGKPPVCFPLPGLLMCSVRQPPCRAKHSTPSPCLTRERIFDHAVRAVGPIYNSQLRV